MKSGACRATFPEAVIDRRAIPWKIAAQRPAVGLFHSNLGLKFFLNLLSQIWEKIYLIECLLLPLLRRKLRKAHEILLKHREQWRLFMKICSNSLSRF